MTLMWRHCNTLLKCPFNAFLFIMLTSSNGNIFRVTGPLCGEFTGPGEFPAQKPVTRSFDLFFDLRLNKRLSKQPWGWCFETPSWSLWRQCNDAYLYYSFTGENRVHYQTKVWMTIITWLRGFWCETVVVAPDGGMCKATAMIKTYYSMFPSWFNSSFSTKI